MTDALYQRAKRALKMMSPTTPSAIARELDTDPDATRLALEDMKRRGLAISKTTEEGATVWCFRDKKAPAA
jgi:post-segregation antitoxin (ccd killing protein)